jgi:hypothetical protein
MKNKTRRGKQERVLAYPFLQLHVEGEYRFYHAIPRELEDVPRLAGIVGLAGASLQYLWFREIEAGALIVSHMVKGDDGRPAVRVFGAILPRPSAEKLMRRMENLSRAVDYLDQLLSDASRAAGPVMIPVRDGPFEKDPAIRSHMTALARRTVLRSFEGEEQYLYTGDLSPAEVVAAMDSLPLPIRTETSACFLHCAGCCDDRLLIAAVAKSSDIMPLPKTVRVTGAERPFRCPLEEQLDRMEEEQIHVLEEESRSAREFVSQVMSQRGRGRRGDRGQAPPSRLAPWSGKEERQPGRRHLPAAVKALLILGGAFCLIALLLPRVSVLSDPRQICVSITISGAKAIIEDITLLAAGICAGSLIGKGRA